MNEIHITLLVVCAVIVAVAHAVVIVRDIYLLTEWRKDEPRKRENDKVVLERNKQELAMCQERLDWQRSELGRVVTKGFSEFKEGESSEAAIKDEKTP